MPGIATAIGIGLGGGVPPLGNALSRVAAAKVLQYVRADLGITLNGTRVSAWADQSSAGVGYTQGTAANQPLYSATGGPNSTAMVSLDSTARYMTSTLTTPDPATTPTCIWLVGRSTLDGPGRRIVSDAGNTKRLVYQRIASPNFAIYDGGVGVDNDNAGMAVNTWGRIIALFTGTTGDRLKCRATNVTGEDVGNQAVDTERLLGQDNAASCLTFDFLEVMYLNAALSATEEANLDTYVTARYGTGLV